MPWRAKSEFGDVEVRPSEPPSNTWIASSCQIERSCSLTAPGISASSVVFRSHVAPAVPAVATHGTVAGNGKSETVAGSLPPPGVSSLSRSVMRTVATACSWPV